MKLTQPKEKASQTITSSFAHYRRDAVETNSSPRKNSRKLTADHELICFNEEGVEEHKRGQTTNSATLAAVSTPQQDDTAKNRLQQVRRRSITNQARNQSNQQTRICSDQDQQGINFDFPVQQLQTEGEESSESQNHSPEQSFQHQSLTLPLLNNDFHNNSSSKLMDPVIETQSQAHSIDEIIVANVYGFIIKSMSKLTFQLLIVSLLVLELVYIMITSQQGLWDRSENGISALKIIITLVILVAKKDDNYITVEQIQTSRKQSKIKEISHVETQIEIVHRIDAEIQTDPLLQKTASVSHNPSSIEIIQHDTVLCEVKQNVEAELIKDDITVPLVELQSPTLRIEQAKPTIEISPAQIVHGKRESSILFQMPGALRSGFPIQDRGGIESYANDSLGQKQLTYQKASPKQLSNNVELSDNFTRKAGGMFSCEDFNDFRMNAQKKAGEFENISKEILPDGGIIEVIEEDEVLPAIEGTQAEITVPLKDSYQPRSEYLPKLTKRSFNKTKSTAINGGIKKPTTPKVSVVGQNRSAITGNTQSTIFFAKQQAAFQHKIKNLEKQLATAQATSTRKIEALEKKLKNTKIFLNMVIHDMRNPTTSIDFAIKEVLKIMSTMKEANQLGKALKDLDANNNNVFGTVPNISAQQNPFSQQQFDVSIKSINDTSKNGHNSAGLPSGEGSKGGNGGRLYSQDFNLKAMSQFIAGNQMELKVDDSQDDMHQKFQLNRGPSSKLEFNNRQEVQDPILMASIGKKERKNSSVSMSIGDSNSDESFDNDLDYAPLQERPVVKAKAALVPQLNLSNNTPLKDDIKAPNGRKLIESHIVFQPQSSKLINTQQLNYMKQNKSSRSVIKQSSDAESSLSPSKRVSVAGSSNENDIKYSNPHQSNNVGSSRREYKKSQSSSEDGQELDEDEKKEQEMYQTFGKQHSCEQSGVQDVKSEMESAVKVKEVPQDRSLNSYFAKEGKESQYDGFPSAKAIANGLVKGGYFNGEEVEGLLQNAHFSSTMLLNLINDLLDLAKMENQSFNLNASYFNLLDEVITAAVATLDHQIKEKRIKIQLLNKGGQDEGFEHYLKSLHGDKSRFLQIMLNFLSNALKFTPDYGTVKIETIVKETQEMKMENGSNSGKNRDQRRIRKIMTEFEMMAAKKCLTPRNNHKQSLMDNKNNFKAEGGQNIQKYINFEIRITDSGCGISPENISKLFLNFSRLEEHRKANERGTGLGLSICKSLLEKMGGSVAVESDGVGKGTTFIMRMQAKCKVVPILVAPVSTQHFAQEFSGFRTNKKINLARMKSHANVFDIFKPCTTVQIKKKTTQTEQIEMDCAVAGDKKVPKRSQSYRMPKQECQLEIIDTQGNKNANTDQQLRMERLKFSVAAVRHGQDKYAEKYSLLKDSPKATKPVKKPGFVRLKTLDEKKVEKGLNFMSQMQPISKVNKLLKVPTGRSRKSIVSRSSFQADQLQQGPPKYKILVANDDSFQLMILTRVLTNFKDCFDVVDQAENGMVAAKMALQHTNNKSFDKFKQILSGGKPQTSQQRAYDVILLDLDMPILNGYDACSQIRQSDSSYGIHTLLNVDCRSENLNAREAGGVTRRGRGGQQVLIIALTAFLNPDTIERCQCAGFDDWIESPLTRDKIQERILNRLEERRKAQIALNKQQSEYEEYKDEGEDELENYEGNQMYVDDEAAQFEDDNPHHNKFYVIEKVESMDVGEEAANNNHQVEQRYSRGPKSGSMRYEL